MLIEKSPKNRLNFTLSVESVKTDSSYLIQDQSKLPQNASDGIERTTLFYFTYSAHQVSEYQA